MGSCFLRIMSLNKYFEAKTASNKNTMKTYSSLQKPVVFMYFWLNYCNENLIERIPVGVKNI